MHRPNKRRHSWRRFAQSRWPSVFLVSRYLRAAAVGITAVSLLVRPLLLWRAHLALRLDLGISGPTDITIGTAAIMFGVMALGVEGRVGMPSGFARNGNATATTIAFVRATGETIIRTATLQSASAAMAARMLSR